MPSKHVTAPSRSAAQHGPHGPHAGADAVTLRAELVMQRCESGSLVLWASAAGCQQAQNSKICAAAAPRQPNPAAAPNTSSRMGSSEGSSCGICTRLSSGDPQQPSRRLVVSCRWPRSWLCA